VLDALEALEIPYMVVGSFASTFWARPAHDPRRRGLDGREIAGEKIAWSAAGTQLPGARSCTKTISLMRIPDRR
jgi:hypothetical protein